jgi:hypothetical protein
MQGARMKKPAFLPEEALVLASAHERQMARDYRLLMLRFLPCYRALSRLMGTLMQECERRLDELTETSARLGLGELPAGGCCDRQSVDGRHFFFTSELAVHQALARALAGEEHSLRYYQQLLEASAAPLLEPLFVSFIDQKRTQHHVLEENRYRL